MSKYQNHQNKLNEITIYLQKKFPESRFFSRHVGKFLSMRMLHSIKDIHSIEGLKQWLFYAKNKYIVAINKPGMSDQYMIMPVMINGKKIPVHIEIETKTGTGRLSSDQKRWKAVCETMGVKYIESRKKEDVEKELETYVKYLTS